MYMMAKFHKIYALRPIFRWILLQNNWFYTYRQVDMAKNTTISVYGRLIYL